MAFYRSKSNIYVNGSCVNALFCGFFFNSIFIILIGNNAFVAKKISQTSYVFFLFFFIISYKILFYLATTFVAFRDKSDSRHVIGQGEWGKIEM